jgi:predicted nucleic acid-binding protein
MQIIVSDSTTIITLLNIDQIDILTNIFEKVLIPSKVYEEITIDENIVLDRGFFVKKEVTDKTLYKLLIKSLDEGESEAIVLAKEMEFSLIIDEKKGRKIAKNLDINIFGFVGLLILNYRLGYITRQKSNNIFYKAKEAGFRVGEKLEKEFLALLEK